MRMRKVSVKRMLAMLAVVAAMLLMCAAALAEAVPVTKVSVSGGTQGEALLMNPGESKLLAVMVLPRNATNKTLNWTSSDETVATVADGKVVAVGLGECTITCETTDGSGLRQQLDVVVSSKYIAVLEEVKVEHNSIGSPEVLVRVRNTSEDKDIIAFTFATKCYDAYGNLLKAHGFGDTEESWIWQDGIIKPGKAYDDDDWCWTLYGFDTAYRIEVWLTHYRTSDGVTTTITPSDYHVITWNKY